MQGKETVSKGQQMLCKTSEQSEQIWKHLEITVRKSASGTWHFPHLFPHFRTFRYWIEPIGPELKLNPLPTASTSPQGKRSEGKMPPAVGKKLWLNRFANDELQQERQRLQQLQLQQQQQPGLVSVGWVWQPKRLSFFLQALRFFVSKNPWVL